MGVCSRGRFAGAQGEIMERPAHFIQNTVPSHPASRRLMVVGIAICVHVLLVYLLANGLASKIVEVLHAPIEISPQVHAKLVPPPPQPVLVKPQVNATVVPLISI